MSKTPRRPADAAPDESPLTRGLAAYSRDAWDDAYAALSSADEAAPLDADNLEILGWSAAMTGRNDTFIALFERLHDIHQAAGNVGGAARTAFWLALRYMWIREFAQGGAWHSRLDTLLADIPERAEHGYRQIVRIHRSLAAGDLKTALDAAVEAGRIGRRFGHRDIVEFARNLEGRTLIRLGEVNRGLALLDEAMLSARSGRLSPMFTGLVFCSVIAGCQTVYAMERSREWTDQLGDWCESHPQLGIFSGICMVHRAEVMAFGGDWPRAVAEVERARSNLDPRADAEAFAAAHYQQGEIHRMRGETEAAEAAYRAAHLAGSEPQPGLALLRLQSGNVAAAAASIRQVLAATPDRLRRVRQLPAAVEIMIAAREIDAATELAGELEATAAAYDSVLLRAMSAHARGSVALARGGAAEAVPALRDALQLWLGSGAPYLAARTRTLIASACRSLGDSEGAELELAAAAAVFESLGARPELERIASASDPVPVARPGGLTGREIEVLTLVASGQTNKGIGRALGLSEKTVDRHVSNILTKLDVPSRSAATAAAFHLGLIDITP